MFSIFEAHTFDYDAERPLVVIIDIGHSGESPSNSKLLAALAPPIGDLLLIPFAG